MKILVRILVILIVLVALVVAVGIFLPSTVHVERSIVIDAPPAVIYDQLNSFKNFNQWSPWAQIDPTAQYSFEGAESGVGAKMIWASENPDVGNGSQEIISSEPNETITNLLIFDGMDPSRASYIIAPADMGTTVTWTMDADMGMNIMGRYFGLFMDKMLGPIYEKGLNSMKIYMETLPIYDSEITIETVESQAYVSINEYVDNDPTLISTKMAANYGALMSYLQQVEVEVAGYPLAIYHNYTEVGMDMECALPIANALTIEDERIIAGETYAGKVVKAVHIGPYENLEATHGEIDAYIQFKKLEVAGDPWEVYVTDPGDEPDPEKWITHVYYPIK